MADGGPAAGDGGDPHGGRQLQLLPQCQFPAGVSGGIPAQQGANPGGVVGRDDYQAALGSGPDQGRGVEPAADRVLPRPQVFPAQQRVAVEQQGCGVPAEGHRFGTDGGHHEGRGLRNSGLDLVPGGGDDRFSRKRTAQLLRGAEGSRGATP